MIHMKCKTLFSYARQTIHMKCLALFSSARKMFHTLFSLKHNNFIFFFTRHMIMAGSYGFTWSCVNPSVHTNEYLGGYI